MSFGELGGARVEFGHRFRLSPGGWVRRSGVTRSKASPADLAARCGAVKSGDGPCWRGFGSEAVFCGGINFGPALSVLLSEVSGILGFIVFSFSVYSGACQGRRRRADPGPAHHPVELGGGAGCRWCRAGPPELALHFSFGETIGTSIWKNPGAERALPLEIEWELPEGYEVGEIRWPAAGADSLGRDWSTTATRRR